jgi:hypothetical protein
MTGVIAACLLWWASFGSPARLDALAWGNEDPRVRLSQTTVEPARTGQRPSEAAGGPPPDRPPKRAEEEQKPPATSTPEALKPFEPAEKVKADQAVDFPADI